MTANREAIPLDAVIAAYQDDAKMAHQMWVLWAADCAERVLPIFEGAYPDDKRPRKAIEAARAWIADPTEENRQRAKTAAYAAYAAAYARASGPRTSAAYAARYATNAVYAASATLSASNAAARCATNAVRAANPANRDKAGAAERKWQALRLIAIYHDGASQ